jgi:hypothetical protein
MAEPAPAKPLHPHYPNVLHGTDAVPMVCLACGEALRHRPLEEPCPGPASVLAPEVEELRSRVVLLERLVRQLCEGKGHDLSWMPFYYSKSFSPTDDDRVRLLQFAAALDAKAQGVPATQPDGYRCPPPEE